MEKIGVAALFITAILVASGLLTLCFIPTVTIPGIVAAIIILIVMAGCLFVGFQLGEDN